MVKTRHGKMDWSELRKEHVKAVCCLCCRPVTNLYAEYIRRNTGLDEAQLESRLLGEISITSDTQMIPPYGRK